MKNAWKTWGVAALLAGAASGCGGDDAASCDEPGVACVWAGTGELGFNGDGLDRRATTFYWVMDLEFAPDGTPYVLDWNNHKVRRVLADDTFETVVGDFVGDGPPDQSDLTPAGAPGTTVSLNHPTDMQFEPDGRMLLMAWHNHKLRSWDPVSGLVHVLCGRGAGYAGDGGDAEQALLNQPKGLVRAPDGALFILDQRNFRVRRIAPDFSMIETVAGNGTPGFSGDGGAATAAQLKFEAGPNPEPSGGLALAPHGRLYVADSLNHRIRRVDLAANTIETIAGTGEPGYSGDGGPALDAQLSNPRDLEIGPDGRLYVADTENQRIRAIDLASGVIETVAGAGVLGTAAEGLPATEVELNRPMGIAFDAAGALYIADTYNSRVLKVPQ